MITITIEIKQLGDWDIAIDSKVTPNEKTELEEKALIVIRPFIDLGITSFTEIAGGDATIAEGPSLSDATLQAITEAHRRRHGR